MAALLLFRHVEAGRRDGWDGPDWLRPVSEEGRRQAEGVVELFAAEPMSRVLTSPYVRCVQSVEPLARARGLAVEERDELAEGAGAGPAISLMRTLAGTSAVLCTHGDVMTDVLDALRTMGLDVPAGYRHDKGGTWKLEGEVPFQGARYLPPPA